MKTLQLIQLYCTVCDYYDTTLGALYQRFSNNSCPKFKDEEVVTTYLFGVAEGNCTVKSIYQFIKNYWADWFPNMPSYQQFTHRIAMLSDVFVALSGLAINGKSPLDGIEHVMDSLPIIVAGEKRSGSAKTANGLCNKGYCSSKGMYYYGVKLHILAQSKGGTLPAPRIAELTPAAVNDLTAAKEYLHGAKNMVIYADKIYLDAQWQAELARQNIELKIPRKKRKGDTLKGGDCISTAVSRVRQPVEAFFAWLIEKTGIQSASKVRSIPGLISFVFARLAAVFLCV